MPLRNAGRAGPFERQRRLEAVTRRALVQRQRCDRVERARRQVVGVHQARLEPAASAGVDGRQRIGHRPDAVAAPRQQPMVSLSLSSAFFAT